MNKKWLTEIGYEVGYQIIQPQLPILPQVSAGNQQTLGPNPASFTATVPGGKSGVPTNVTIQARDSVGNNVSVGGNVVVVDVNGSNNAAPQTATDNGDGTYSFTYIPIFDGNDSLAITADGIPISGSPYTSIVGLGPPFAGTTTANVPSGVQGQPTNILITSRDQGGTAENVGGASVVVNVSGANPSVPSQQILSYFKSLPGKSSGRCIIGQNWKQTLAHEFDSYDTILSQTGKQPGMFGMALTFLLGDVVSVTSQAWTTRGCVINAICTFKNPTTGGSETDLTPTIHNTVTNGTAEHTQFFGTQIPNLISTIQNILATTPNAVFVLRPFREENLTNVFWWSGASVADFTSLWQQTYNALIAAGLGPNLLFDYNVFANVGNDLTNYPGSSFVDIVSFDFYGDNPTLSGVITTYNNLLTLNKPIRQAEFGFNNSSTPPAPNTRDNTVVLNAIKNTFTQIFSLMYWDGGWDLQLQNNATVLMNDPIILTASDVQAPTRLVTATVDNGNGTYGFTYTPQNLGTDSIDIKLNGSEISGSPYSSIVGSVPSGLYPNLPAGYSNPDTTKDTFTNGVLNGSIATENGWTLGSGSIQLRDASTYAPGGGVASPVHPPASPNFIGEALYPAGFSGAGNAPGVIASPNFLANNWTGLYLVMDVQLSSNFQSHSSGINKAVTAVIHANPCFVISAQSASFWQVRLQNLWNNGSGGGAINLSNISGANANVTLGLWQRVEIQLVANTPGVTNGIVRVWLSNFNSSGVLVAGPTKITEVTNIGWSSSVQSNFWSGAQWNPIWGGTGTTPVANQMYMWMDHMSFAGHV